MIELEGDSEPVLVLASRSPRRKALLEEAGYDFRVVPAAFIEPPPDEGETAEAYAVRLACDKARDVADRLAREGHGNAIVVAADTVVDLNGAILGQPEGEDGARAMLRRLSGSRHAVVTGVVLLETDTGRVVEEAARTELAMAAMTEEQIEEYVASGESAGKAGGYAIQETGDRFVSVVSGSMSNVVGLPMELLARMLARLGRA